MHINKSLENKSLSSSLPENLALFRELFTNIDTIRYREFAAAPGATVAAGEPEWAVIYCDGLASSEIIDQDICQRLAAGANLPVGEYKQTSDLAELVFGINFGDTVILGAGGYCALVNSKGFSTRGISEPEGEKILLGPREGFSESVMTNLGLVRRKIKSNELKCEFLKLGAISQTPLALCYVEGVVKPALLESIKTKLSSIDTDCILDSNYVAEYIRESGTIFPLEGRTERPDAFAAKLLEGRVGIICDGSPVALTFPYLFIENFQSGEDYYVSPLYASFNRLLRMAAFILTVFMPAFFVMALSYCQSLLPDLMLTRIAVERAGVPLPVALECAVMLVIFELLRETGVRMPSYVGQALSIVGALIVGSAAVGAHLISDTMVIVIAITGISSLIVPRLSAVCLFWRFALLGLTTLFGVPGFFAGAALMLLRLATLKSYGVRHLFPEKKWRFQNIKDTFFRASMKKMKTRLGVLSDNSRRANN